MSMAEMMIESDVTCVKCGYNLRGLATSGVCSECGTPIVRSLADAPPSAQQCLEIATLLSKVLRANLIFGFMVVLGVVTLPFVGPSPISRILYTFVAIGVSAAAWYRARRCIDLVSSGMLVSQSVERPDARDSIGPCAAIVAIMATACGFGVVGAAWVDNAFLLITPLAGILLCVTTAVGAEALLRLLVTIADRIPDHTLRESLKRRYWRVGVVAISLTIAAFIGPIIAWIEFQFIIRRMIIALRQRARS